MSLFVNSKLTITWSLPFINDASYKVFSKQVKMLEMFVKLLLDL